ncbi:MAG: hypothetical protein M1608_00820 [Candidatus Omnitrophica bacterium]|nr:hypothetical protein [Candidatus Omnitrophota bacterium]
MKEPAQLVRIMAQSIFSALVQELEGLRCAVCVAVFTAPAPPEAGLGKYDPSVGVMLALMRYGAGLPLYRMDQNQIGTRRGNAEKSFLSGISTRFCLVLP